MDARLRHRMNTRAASTVARAEQQARQRQQASLTSAVQARRIKRDLERSLAKEVAATSGENTDAVLERIRAKGKL